MVGPFLVSVVAMVLPLAVMAASVVAMVLSLAVTAASVSVPSLGGAECAVRAQLLGGVAEAKVVMARLVPWVPAISALAPPLLCGPPVSTAPG